MIDQLTIDRIMDAANIVDVVSEFVTLRKRGVNYIGLCPFHSDRTPSLSVSPSKGIFKCFACGKGGNVVHFVMEHEQMTYPEALHWLAKKYGITIQEKELTEEQKQNLNLRESLFVVNQFANEWFHRQISDAKINSTYPQKHPSLRVGCGVDALQYFRSRGFRDDTIKKFQLGYCSPLPHDFSDVALKAGYKREFLLKTGLCYQKEDGSLIDRFRGRVIFPIHSLSGKVVGFGGRVLDARTKGVQMKYVNSPESEIYHKSRELYGMFFSKTAIVRNNKCFLVEGYTDVISMHQCGVENVVASSGTALTQEQIRLIHRFTPNVTLLFDGDAAGIKASLRGIDMFLQEGMFVKVCLFPDGDDPDSFARKHNATEFQDFIAKNEQDFIVFKANLLLKEAGKDPTKRVQLIGTMVDSIAVIPDSISRSVYVRECSELLKVDERLLVSAIAEKREKAAPSLPPDLERGPMNVALTPGEGISTPKEEQPTANKVNDIIVRQEQDILRLVISYGERVMCLMQIDEANFKELRVLEAVVDSFKEDKITFALPLHKQMLSMAYNAMMTDKDFNAERFFIHNQNGEISRYAADLIADRYALHDAEEGSQQKSDEERLCELVPMVLNAYRLTVIQEEMKQIQVDLSTMEVACDSAKITNLMRRYMELQSLQNELAKLVGDRVVLGV